MSGPIVFANPCSTEYGTETCEASPEDGLYLSRPDRRGVRQILSGFGAVHPRFSPDGRWIVFQHGNEGFFRSDLYRVKTDGSGLRQLTSGGAGDVKPEFLADGRILFVSHKPGGPYPGLFVMESDGSNIKRVTKAVGAASTDGRRIAVSRCPRKDDCGIYLYRPDGTLIRRLTETVHIDTDLAISPNGRLVAFERSYGYAGKRLTLVRTDGKRNAWPISQPPDDVERDFTRHDPVWSPDSRSILFREDNRWNYHSESPSGYRFGVKPIKGGRAVFLTREFDGHGRVLLEPDWGTRR